MNEKLEKIKAICVEKYLVPWEGSGPKTADGRFMAYPDPGSINLKVKDEFGNWVPHPQAGLPITIGYGITFDELGKPIQLGDIWDEERVLNVKQLILNKFLAALLAMSPSLMQESAERVAPILSWVYNLGLGNYRISTFKRKIDAGEWQEAAEQCLVWNKARGKIMRGLTLRRIAEAKGIIDG